MPLALKIWLGKLAFEFLRDKYLKWEKNVVVDYLADLETKLVEESLPSSNDHELEAADDNDNENDVLNDADLESINGSEDDEDVE